MGTENRSSLLALAGNVVVVAFGVVAVVIGALIILLVVTDRGARRRIVEHDACGERKVLADKNSASDDGNDYLTKSEWRQGNAEMVSGMKSWTSRKLSAAMNSIRNFVVKCLNEAVPGYSPGRKGRVQGSANGILFNRAILYQLSHARCSSNRACQMAFVATSNGYKSKRSLYGYWHDHPLVVAQATEHFAEEIARSGLSPRKFYEEYCLKTDAELQVIKV